MNDYKSTLKLFTANSHPELAADIARNLDMTLSDATVKRFSDGEISVQVNETVRGSDVFVIQPTCNPVNDNLMELLIMIDAFKRASAGRINAVIPYFGYARQDRKVNPRDPISAKLVADLIVAAGADRVISMDLHAAQLQGFFNIPVDTLEGIPILSEYFANKFSEADDIVVAAPDIGSVNRARTFVKRMDVPIAIVDKRRHKPNESEVMHVIGDVKNKKVIMVDDLIDTGGTIANAAKKLMELGAKEVYACCTHAVLSGPAVQRLKDSPLKELVVLNTIPISEEKNFDKMKILSVGPVFAEAIKRIYESRPISTIYE